MLIVVINLLTNKLTLCKKSISAILLERGLWPQEGVQLEFEKSKCFNCQIFIICRICIQGQKCDFCKEIKKHNGKFTKQRICDICCL